MRRIRIAIILVFTLALLCLPLVSDQRPHIIDVKNSEVLGADIFSEGVQSTELEEYRVSDSPLPSVLPPVPYQHEPTWNHMYGYENHVQAAEDHVLCSDGGYALVGVSGFDIRVDRTDSFGIHQWNRTYGGVEFESSSAILENSSGGFIIAGYTRSYGAGDFDVWILRIDAIGNLLWNTTFGGTGSDYAQSMIECNDGGYAIIGYTTSFGAGETDVWLIRLDNDGNHLWNATYGGTQFDYGTDLVQHPDNGFVIGGYSGPPGDYDFYCIRTNSTGHSLWERTYVGPSYDLCHSVWRASNGIIVLAGEGYNPVSGSTDGRILFLNNNGDLMWDYFYGGTRLDVFRDMIACDAGGYALCGFSYSYDSTYYSNLWVVRTDEWGNMTWYGAFGTSPDLSYGGSIVEDSFGNLIIAGHVNRSIDGHHAFWLVNYEPLNIVWREVPNDQFVVADEQFVYYVEALTVVLIDQYWINDTTHFSIDLWGEIRNVTPLTPGKYGIEVWANDTNNEVINASFSVTVTHSDAWTVLVYLDGDNDLEEYAFSDLNSMETVLPSPDVHILVFVDFWSTLIAPYSGARCYEVTYDTNLNTINSIELSHPLPLEPNMGDWQTLRDFIVFGQSYAPAENYLLVLWDHGSGYESVCVDETSADYLSMHEVQIALSDPQVQYLDVVAFDACMMGQLEVAYELRDVTDYLVFSEEGVPVSGFPYEDILANLTSFPDSKPLTVAEGMPYFYGAAYRVGGRYHDPLLNWACLSSVDTSQLQDIVTCLHILGSELSYLLDSPMVYDRVCVARVFAQGFTRADFVDLGGFASALANVFSDSAYPQLIPLARDLGDVVAAAIVHEEHLSGVPEATGLAVVLNKFIDDLDLADDTLWDEFMDEFTDVGSTRGTAVELSAYAEYFGYLEWADDSVYYEFVPAVTGLYTFGLEALLLDYFTDFDLYLYDEYNDVLASSLGSDSTESFTVHLTRGDTYYIEVYSFPGDTDGVGVFHLTVQQGVTTLPQAELWLLVMAIGIDTIIVVSVAVMVFLLRRGPSIPKSPPRQYRHPPDTPSSERPETMRFCAYCGALIPSRARYCPVCGSSV
ncbi:MAG: clostripain-related cysteine peptidase [Candidatus Hermodarchaeota archaeon]|nr:clostripain-related cysteine peptidase [Candidatus Hermodarchaeota archaeon]